MFLGSENLLIPTVAGPGSRVQLTSLPDDAWSGTSAHYYINNMNSNEQDCNWNDSEPDGISQVYTHGAHSKDGRNWVNLLPTGKSFNPSKVFSIRIEVNGNTIRECIPDKSTTNVIHCTGTETVSGSLTDVIEIVLF